MGSTFDDTLTAAVAPWGITLSPEQLERLRAHFQAVVAANRTMNLTRIVDPAAAAVKHYADSLAAWVWALERGITAERLLDIGTGAGFPAVPLAVVQPSWTVTAIDATRKKTRFLAQTAASISLTNLRAEHAHSRHWRTGQTFHIVTLRAVAPWPESVALAARHLAPGGWAVCYQAKPQSPAGGGPTPPGSLPANLRPDAPFRYTLQAGNETIDRVLYIYRKADSGKPIR